MTLAIGAVLLIVGLVASAVVAVGIPLFFGIIAWDLIDRRSRVETPVAPESASMRIAVERGFARGFVILGGLFWSIAAFAGLYSFRQTGVNAALMAALIPLIAVAVTLIVGWYYERMTAAMLTVASFAVVSWGVIYQFELGVWMIVTATLIVPMLTAATLFWLARRDQEAYERAEAHKPELALLVAARSSLGR